VSLKRPSSGGYDYT